MSDRLDVAFVEIEPDFSDFNRAVESGVRDASREIDQQLNRTLNDLEGDFEAFADDALTEVQNALDRIAQAGEDSADEIDAAYDDLEGAIRNAFDGAQRAASSAFDDIRRDADIAFSDIEVEAERAATEMEESFRSASDDIDTSVSEGTESASGGFLGLADSAFDAGTDIQGAMKGAAGKAGVGALVAAVLAATAAFVDMGREALDVSGDLTRISSASAEGFSTLAVEEFREGLRDIQTEFGLLTDQTIPALRTAVAQGVPEENAIAFLEEAARSAVVTGEDLTDTVSVINGLMAQFGDEFATAGEAADFLTVTLGNTTANAADVGDVIGEISGFARDAGVGADELSAALAAMSITGRDAGTSGGQLAALIEELGDATTPVAEAFNELTGQSFKDFIAEGGNVQQAAQIIADGAADAGLSVVELASSAETSSAILALSTEQGTQRFNDALAETRSAMGTTEQTFGELEDSGALAFSQLEGAFASLRDEAGVAVAPLVAQFTEQLIPVIQEMTPIVAAIGEVLISSFGTAFDLLGPFIDLIVLLFDAIQPLLEGALGPMFLITEQIGQIIADLVIPIFEILLPILTALFEIVSPILNPALQLLAFVLGLIADVISEYVTPFLEDLADVVQRRVVPWITNITDRFGDLRDGAGGAIAWIASKFSGFVSAIGAGASAFGEFFSGMVGIAKGAINQIIDAWNRIDFGFSVSIPSWVPQIGGNSFSIPDIVPDIPRLQTGGFTTDTGLALLHPDEMVLPLSNQSGIAALAQALQQAGAGGGGETTVIVKIGERELTDIVDTEVFRTNQTLMRRARAGTRRNT